MTHSPIARHALRSAAATLGLAALLPSLALGYECPEGYTYEADGEGRGSCLVQVDYLPVDPEPYCHWLELGYQGYHFNLKSNRKYVCPEGSRQAINGHGLGFCLWDDLEFPLVGAEPSCDELERGHFGFTWSLCPEGMDYSEYRGTGYCYARETAPTDDTQAYCRYLDDGYMGYYWETDDNPRYECGEGARQATNGHTLSFCLYSDIEPPPGAELTAQCNAAHWGAVGYSWSL